MVSDNLTELACGISEGKVDPKSWTGLWCCPRLVIDGSLLPADLDPSMGTPNLESVSLIFSKVVTEDCPLSGSVELYDGTLADCWLSGSDKNSGRVPSDVCE